MMRIGFVQANPEDTLLMQTEYLARCAAPVDGMWQSFVDMADTYLIEQDGEPVGYCAINGDRQLLRFYCLEGLQPGSIYQATLQHLQPSGAIVSTAEPEALALALDHQTAVKTRSIMYHFLENQPCQPANFPTQTLFKAVEPANLETTVEFAHHTLGANIDWLLAYFDDLVSRHELYALWQGTTVLATGECRLNALQPTVADVGMIVGKAHRRKGVATNVLKALTQIARNQGKAPICSTEITNIGAQKAISAAGFRSYHRILDVTF